MQHIPGDWSRTPACLGADRPHIINTALPGAEPSTFAKPARSPVTRRLAVGSIFQWPQSLFVYTPLSPLKFNGRPLVVRGHCPGPPRFRVLPLLRAPPPPPKHRHTHAWLKPEQPFRGRTAWSRGENVNDVPLTDSSDCVGNWEQCQSDNIICEIYSCHRRCMCNIYRIRGTIKLGVRFYGSSHSVRFDEIGTWIFHRIRQISTHCFKRFSSCDRSIRRRSTIRLIGALKRE
ncbi:hypothetical protein J6590_000313 [Homalodisca vitripennis]|nr:hypothetical protein J6590_000313 [Homalodisca vitripennis]